MTIRVLLLAGLLSMTSRSAFANGRFPNASLFLIAPGDPAHWVVRTTFGVLESRDAGSSFSWICEKALDLDDQEDPMLALTGNGSLVAATYDGILTSRDGCDYEFATGLAGDIVGDLTRDPNSPERLLAFTVRGQIQGGFFSQLARSDDHGKTFTPIGDPLNAELLPLSLEIAQGDSSQVYVTARSGSRDEYRSVLLSSSDGGLHFSEYAVPYTDDRSLGFIAAVHPDDRNLVYLRTSDPAGNRLLLSSDGGASFSSVFTAQDGLYGFALSPDGAEMVFGGPDEGIWAASSRDGSGLEFRSSTPVSCLSYGADALYGCIVNDPLAAVSKSLDGGRTFSSLLSLPTLCGPTACGAPTDVARVCPAYWPAVAQTLGTTCGNIDATGGSSSAAAGSASGGALGAEARPSGGCSVPFGPARTWGILGALALLVSLAARRQRRANV